MGCGIQSILAMADSELFAQQSELRRMGTPEEEVARGRAMPVGPEWGRAYQAHP